MIRNRFLLLGICLFVASPLAAQDQNKVVTGKVVKVLPADSLVIVRNADGQDLRIVMDEKTPVLVGNQLARPAQLTEGASVRVIYALDANRFLARTVIVTPEPVPVLEGRIAKVMAPDRVLVLRTADGKEVRVLLDDRSSINLSDRAGKLLDLREEMPVAVEYVLRDNQHVVTTLRAAPVAVVPAAATGKLRGLVMEGDRPQPGLEVLLIAPSGRTVATTTTAADGAFLFDKVIPGVYRVYSAKPASKTQGETQVTVQAGEIAAATLSLLR